MEILISFGLYQILHVIPEIFISDLMDLMISEATQTIHDAEDNLCENDRLLIEASWVNLFIHFLTQYVPYQRMIKLRKLW